MLLLMLVVDEINKDNHHKLRNAPWYKKFVMKEFVLRIVSCKQECNLGEQRHFKLGLLPGKLKKQHFLPNKQSILHVNYHTQILCSL